MSPRISLIGKCQNFLVLIIASLLLSPDVAKSANEIESAAKCRGLFAHTNVSVEVEPGVIVERAEGTPTHCLVRGVIDDSIKFELRMPVSGWKGRYMFHAAGGLAGTIGDTSSLIKHGFAMATSDAGNSFGPESSAFARTQASLMNFGFRANHLSVQLTKSLIREFYGRDIEYSYIWGCSNGGRAALVEALLYPDEFDGIIAGAPALRWGEEMQTWGIAAHRAQTRNPLDAAAVLVLSENSKRACDSIDGAEDGVISDPASCTLKRLALDDLICSEPENDGCLTSGQVETAKFLYEGYFDSDGHRMSHGVYPGAESSGDWMLWVTGEQSIGLTPAHKTMGEMASDVLYRVSGKDAASFDLEGDRELLAEMTDAVDVPDPDFSGLEEYGAKLLIYNGMNDMPCRAKNLEDYINLAASLNGGMQEMSEYLRVYMVPGMLHCAGGPGPWLVDFIGAMVNWVELEEAPQVLEGYQPGVENWFAAFALPGMKTLNYFESVREVMAVQDSSTVFSRPICPYPEVAKYAGSGDLSIADSFTCVTR